MIPVLNKLIGLFEIRTMAIMKQPDFRQLFYGLSTGIPQKINYKVRLDSNMFHDIVFLDSLIHDGRFQRNQIKQSAKKLIIPIERDCWELPVKELKNGSELYTTKSILTLFPVLELKWTVDQPKETKEENEQLWINGIWVNRKDNDQREYILSGRCWSVSMQLDHENLAINLQDLEVPHLFSGENNV